MFQRNIVRGKDLNKNKLYIIMTNEEKIALLEDMLELEANTLTPETELADLEEYDSMAKLSLIVLMDEECDKKLTGEQIREFKTVDDIMAFMG